MYHSGRHDAFLWAFGSFRNSDKYRLEIESQICDTQAISGAPDSTLWNSIIIIIIISLKRS